MNKNELINKVSEECGISKALSGRCVDTVFNTIVQIVKDGGKATFPGFGVFGASHRKARKGRNPQNPDQVINIPAKTVPSFKAGSKFKDEVKDTQVA